MYSSIMFNTDLTDLKYDGFSIDEDGDYVINLSFVNGKSFSIPTRVELPLTDALRVEYTELSKVPLEGLKTIKEEVSNYLYIYDLDDLRVT
tara:strand:- start:1235 stop:1507 length:273 start_codon:yes stop_codon:yes gene_type:complete